MFGLSKKNDHGEEIIIQGEDDLNLEKPIQNKKIIQNNYMNHAPNHNQNSQNRQNNNNANNNDNSQDWDQDPSWSKILMSDSESLRQQGTVYRQKDTNMVVLVRRLEYFPKLSVIKSTRKLFDEEISRLNKVKDVVEFESNNMPDQNPILAQAALEVESELNRIVIERESFEKKLNSEVDIIDGLVQTILSYENKKPEMVGALLKLYDFDLDNGNKVNHQSNSTTNVQTIKKTVTITENPVKK